jgi:predicted KAP-like P-loop ATPase
LVTALSENRLLRILTDEPKVEGSLGFENYSKALADIIINSEPKFTVGIFGGWGTGKTTLMKMIMQELGGDSSKSSDSKSEVLNIWFNAWRYERERNLAIVPMLKAIINAIKENSRFYSLKKILNAAAASLMKACCVTVLDKVGLPGDKIEQEIESSLLDSMKGTTYSNALDDIETALKKLREKNERLRIVVFIDDMDRCSPDKALELLESIKVFLNIEGVVYVLGMNPDSINEWVKCKYGKDTFVDGSDYL